MLLRKINGSGRIENVKRVQKRKSNKLKIAFPDVIIGV